MQSAELDPALRAQLFAEGSADDVAPGRPIPQVALAEHRNHTPFPSQYFQAVDQHAEVFHVVALRITFDMLRTASDGSLAHAAEQSPLATEDAWDGPANEGCPLWESDFSPFKPRCDVLVAHAFSRPPVRTSPARWPCGVALQWLDEQVEGQTLTWMKHLAVCGPRHFTGSGVSAPQPCEQVALDWRLAVGGQLKEPAQDLLGEDGTLHTAAGARRWDTDARNPVGLGLVRSKGAPAPQLERSIDEPFDPMSATYPPISLGPLARAWLPRRALAGTYDNAWLRQQWPLPPLDFDFGYWNCAPHDQQIDYLPPGTAIHLLNLYPAVGNERAHQWPIADGSWRGLLPADELLVLWRLHNGAMLERPLNLDTLVVDLAALQVCATYRAVLSAKADVRVVESRLQPQHLLTLGGRQGHG